MRVLPLRILRLLVRGVVLWRIWCGGDVGLVELGITLD